MKTLVSPTSPILSEILKNKNKNDIKMTKEKKRKKRRITNLMNFIFDFC